MSPMVERCDLSPGDWIDGKYRIQKVIGEGAFGIVYHVKATNNIEVALKLLRLWDVHPEIRPGLLSRFDMEYETGLIESPYLVHALDHGYVKGNPYIVSEYCKRGDVQQIYNSGYLDIEQVAVDTLLGLRALHRHGKVHRDLKPENVLLRDSGEYALTDFGICGDRNKRMTEMNIIGRPKQLFGTYAYMPPEQLKPNRDATVLPTTDIFSFGVMVYQLLATGELPFGPLNNEGDLVAYIKRGKAGDWNRSLLRTSTAKQWTPLLEGCLEPDYQRRIQTCEQALDMVPHFSANERVEMEPPCQTKIVNGVLLRVMQGENYGTVYYLDDMLTNGKSMITMGRADVTVHNDISITETASSYISRRHCTLELDYTSGYWIVRDGQWVNDLFRGLGHWENSSNGTYVNSYRVTPDGLPFEPGDIISIGDVKLRAEAY